MMDQEIVARTVAKLMDDLDQSEFGGEIARVVVVVEVSNSEGGYVHMRASTTDTTEQMGLLYRGLVTAQEGDGVDDE